jgi:hypothetical protein
VAYLARRLDQFERLVDLVEARGAVWIWWA